MRILRVFSVVLVALGLFVGGFAVYQFYAPSATDKDNQQAAEGIMQDWTQAAPVPSQTAGVAVLPDGNDTPIAMSDGKAFGVIRIPAIKVVSPIAQGVDAGVLRKGVGHFPQSIAPGQVGNFATAGHVCCRTSGQPYKHIDKLNEGDAILVETKTATYTYRVVPMPQCTGGAGPNGHTVVTPDRIDVVNPVPCSESQPTRKLMTLTTCYPDRSLVDLTNRPAPYRLVVWAELDKVETRS